MSYEEYLNCLAPLETFDPEAFVGDSEVPQEVCNLVLALSLAYNDFRDVLVAELWLRDVGVKPEDPPSRKMGLTYGLYNTVVRVRIGFIHELLNLIKESHETIDHQAFKHIVRLLSPFGKNAWMALFDAAMSNPSANELAKALVIVRNKVAFHYDSRELGHGFSRAFIERAGPYGTPFVSRGSNLKETRFYFSDAAAQAYIKSKSTRNIFQ
jgi:hypothetical protein